MRTKTTKRKVRAQLSAGDIDPSRMAITPSASQPERRALGVVPPMARESGGGGGGLPRRLVAAAAPVQNQHAYAQQYQQHPLATGQGMGGRAEYEGASAPAPSRKVSREQTGGSGRIGRIAHAVGGGSGPARPPQQQNQYVSAPVNVTGGGGSNPQYQYGIQVGSSQYYYQHQPNQYQYGSPIQYPPPVGNSAQQAQMPPFNVNPVRATQRAFPVTSSATASPQFQQQRPNSQPLVGGGTIAAAAGGLLVPAQASSGMMIPGYSYGAGDSYGNYPVIQDWPMAQHALQSSAPPVMGFADHFQYHTAGMGVGVPGDNRGSGSSNPNLLYYPKRSQSQGSNTPNVAAYRPRPPTPVGMAGNSLVAIRPPPTVPAPRVPGAAGSSQVRMLVWGRPPTPKILDDTEIVLSSGGSSSEEEGSSPREESDPTSSSSDEESRSGSLTTAEQAQLRLSANNFVTFLSQSGSGTIELMEEVDTHIMANEEGPPAELGALEETEEPPSKRFRIRGLDRENDPMEGSNIEDASSNNASIAICGITTAPDANVTSASVNESEVADPQDDHNQMEEEDSENFGIAESTIETEPSIYVETTKTDEMEGITDDTNGTEFDVDDEEEEEKTNLFSTMDDTVDDQVTDDVDVTTNTTYEEFLPSTLTETFLSESQQGLLGDDDKGVSGTDNDISDTRRDDSLTQVEDEKVQSESESETGDTPLGEESEDVTTVDTTNPEANSRPSTPSSAEPCSSSSSSSTSSSSLFPESEDESVMPDTDDKQRQGEESQGVSLAVATTVAEPAPVPAAANVEALNVDQMSNFQQGTENVKTTGVQQEEFSDRSENGTESSDDDDEEEDRITTTTRVKDESYDADDVMAGVHCNYSGSPEVFSDTVSSDKEEEEEFLNEARRGVQDKQLETSPQMNGAETGLGEVKTEIAIVKSEVEEDSENSDSSSDGGVGEQGIPAGPLKTKVRSRKLLNSGWGGRLIVRGGGGQVRGSDDDNCSLLDGSSSDDSSNVGGDSDDSLNSVLSNSSFTQSLEKVDVIGKWGNRGMFFKDGAGLSLRLAYLQQRLTIPRREVVNDGQIVITGPPNLSAEFKRRLSNNLDLAESIVVKSFDELKKSSLADLSQVKYVIYLMDCDMDFNIEAACVDFTWLTATFPERLVEVLMWRASRNTALNYPSTSEFAKIVAMTGVQLRTLFHDQPVLSKRTCESLANRFRPLLKC